GRRVPRAQARPGARSARASDRASAWQTRRMAQSPGLLRSGSPILLACAQDFAAQQIPNPISVFAVLMTLLDLDIARPSQVDLDVGLDAARTRREDDHAVGEIDRLVDVMGDEQHRLARRIPNLLQLLLQQLAVLRVERTERLIHQQNARIEREQARESHALLHAARQLARIVVAELAE